MSDTILAFCVSETWCYAALQTNNHIHTLMRPINGQHTQATLLLPTIKDLWLEHGKPEPTTIIAVRGPGSFTTIRITVSAAQGFALSFPKANYFAPTANALLAQLAFNEIDPTLTLVNSRRGDFYGQLFLNNTEPSPIETLTVEDIKNIVQQYPNVKACGDFSLNEMSDDLQKILQQNWVELPTNWAAGLISLYHQKQHNLSPEDKQFIPLYLYTPDYKPAKS